MAAVIFLPNRMAGRVLLWLPAVHEITVVMHGRNAEEGYSDLQVRSGR
tara:strand:+ start:164 stop:307 length:144 start_codon:yes stop_codon:yes gene_type:complete